MKPDSMLEELESAAGELGIKVSYEALRTNVGMGGLCRVKGQYRVIIDKRASTRERLATLAQAVSKFDTSGLELHPKVREVLSYYALRRAS